MSKKRPPENLSIAKKSSKKSPEYEKELQKWTLFGSMPGGLREALTIKFQTGYGTTPVGCRGGSRYVEGCWGVPRGPYLLY